VKAIMETYPHFQWDPKQFAQGEIKTDPPGPPEHTPATPTKTTKPKKFWKSKENRRAYLDTLKAQLGGTYESLYRCTFDNLRSTGGSLICLSSSTQLFTAYLQVLDYLP